MRIDRSTDMQKIWVTTKSIDPGQPAHPAQADLGRYILQMH